MQKKKCIKRAQAVLNIEIEGIEQVRDNLGEAFISLVELCLATVKRDGKMVITGVGKSGAIGHKMAATLSSTGAPAVFMHPVEAMHGDLGVLASNDLLIALSYSGETDELLDVLPAAKRFEVPIVAITGNCDSSLSAWCDLSVPMSVEREACPFNLAPTTSTTALLALGDALAIVLLEQRGFEKEDYARLHPAGAIGRSITLRVSEIMRKDERLARVQPQVSVRDALLAMTQARAGSVAVVDADKKLLGIFTDGDFRRHITEDIHSIDAPVEAVMTKNPTTIRADALAVELLNLLEHRTIDDIPVLDENDQVVGVIDIQDLPKFKVM